MIRRITLLALAMALAGCAKHDAAARQGQDLPAPLEAAPAPPYQPQALDPSLRQAALDELTSECQATDPFLRSNALEALSENAPDSAPRPVLDALSDPEASVRFAACVAAGRLRIKLAYQPLLAMVEDPDLRVQAAVRFALHRLGDTRLSHQLETLAANPDPHVRACTAQVLGLLEEPSAVRVLGPMLVDKIPSVRLQAAEAMWRLGSEEGLKDLVAYSISYYPDDQVVALIALAEPRDARVLGHVQGLLTSDFPEVALAAARAAGMLDSDDGWSIAVPRASSDDPRLRALAALAMGAIGRSDLQPVLAPMLKDSVAYVRICAAAGILELHEKPADTP
ncbi:MAG: HEAT repeat domain-containing protein [Tepidisphaeraceae bacterium]